MTLFASTQTATTREFRNRLMNILRDGVELQLYNYNYNCQSISATMQAVAIGHDRRVLVHRILP